MDRDTLVGVVCSISPAQPLATVELIESFMIHVVDAETGKFIALLPDMAGIEELQLSASGDRLVSLNLKNHVRLWQLTGQQSVFLLEDAKGMLPHCLTAKECKEAFLEEAPSPWCLSSQ